MGITNGAYIIDSLNKILVTHPTNHPENFWSIPKGMLMEGETSLEAAIRETMEETNILLTDYALKTKYYYIGSEVYKNKNKKLEGHLFLIDLPLSKMDLDLKCSSTFDCSITGMILPENDITKWETLNFAKKYLHYTQQNLLNLIAAKLVN